MWPSASRSEASPSTGRRSPVDRTALSRWVQRVLPLCGAVARRHRTRVGKTWRVDETYCDCQGTQASSDRAIDEHGQVVDA
jgi:putative transposase